MLGHSDSASNYRRIKIAHDPNNLTWALSAESYGQKLLSFQGWKPGQGLGARGAKHFNSPIPAVKAAYKDNNLGLGASLKSVNADQTRFGLDAFQVLLGRLNSKDEVGAKKLEQKLEDVKLARWAQGRWGGVIFVPGGLLVQGDQFKRVRKDQGLLLSPAEDHVELPTLETLETSTKAAKALRKAERRKRKEARLQKRAESNITGSMCYRGDNEVAELPHNDVKTNRGDDGQAGTVQDKVITGIGNALSTNRKQTKRKGLKDKQKRHLDVTTPTGKLLEGKEVYEDTFQLPTPPSDCIRKQGSSPTNGLSSRNGRHIVRSRNIQAKRAAFADAKSLDEVRQAWSTAGKGLLTNSRSSRESLDSSPQV